MTNNQLLFLSGRKTIRMKHLFKCGCGNYSLAKICSKCGKETQQPKPPKFSLDDKYAGLRRKVRKEALKKKGLV